MIIRPKLWHCIIIVAQEDTYSTKNKKKKRERDREKELKREKEIGRQNLKKNWLTSFRFFHYSFSSLATCSAACRFLFLLLLLVLCSATLQDKNQYLFKEFDDNNCQTRPPLSGWIFACLWLCVFVCT